MATFFKNKVVNELGTSEQTLISTTPASRATIIGMSFCNLTTAVVKASIKLTDATATSGFFIKDVTIPPYQSLRVVNGGEKLVMAESNSLSAFADVANSLDVVVSYVEIV
jgi:hypothetical protein